MRALPFVRDSRAATGSLHSTLLLWLLWILWLPFIIPPTISLLQAHPAPARLVISLTGATLFFTLYLTTTWRTARFLANPAPRVLPEPVTLWTPIAVMLALSVFLLLLNGSASGWGALLIYASTCAAGWLPLRPAVAVIAALVAFTLVGLGLSSGLASAVSPVAFILVPGLVVVAFVRAIGLSQQLRAAREEMARAAAAADERLRIARDLHDLLGHTLSLIALKSELAGRLVSAAPARAATEIRDVETVARHALQEVRDAVAAYRQPTLASELSAAGELLSAAGIVLATAGADAAGDLPPVVEAALAWAVREGVTNVIRHSQAQHCVITVERRAGEVALSIADDGRGSTSSATPPAPAPSASPASSPPVNGHTGSGLSGLSERITALGGHLSAGSRPPGGFTLAVELPLDGAGGRRPSAPATRGGGSALPTGDPLPVASVASVAEGAPHP